MAGAVLGLVGGLFGLGGGGGEASVAEVAKRVQVGDVQILVDEEAQLIAFQIEEGDSSPIVFDLGKNTLSGVTVVGPTSSSTPSGGIPPPPPYQTPLYYSRQQVHQLIASAKEELMTHIDAIKAHLNLTPT
jgi:hypothetical protein